MSYLPRMISRFRVLLLLCLMAVFLVLIFLNPQAYHTQALVIPSATSIVPCTENFPSCGSNIYPVADTYVSRFIPAANYGKGTALSLYSDLKLDPVGINYLKFNLGVIPTGRTFKGAALWLCGYARTVVSKPPFNVALYDVPDTTWQETSLTWINRPAFGTRIASSTITTGWNSTTNFDCTYWNISNYVLQKLSQGTPEVTLAVQMASYGMVNYFSREYTGTIPVSGHEIPKPVIQTRWDKQSRSH